MLESLKEEVCAANKLLARHGLVTLTFGNVSGCDRDKGIVAIKPSGVDYDALRPKDIVMVDLEGNKVEGDLNPSADAATHLMIYRMSEVIGGVTHTHSSYATMFAQAGRGIACLGTTHADHFNGEVPLTRPMTEEEIGGDYEKNTGLVIVERFAGRDPMDMPAVLVACHGPFTWGRDAAEAVENAVALEEIAKTAFGTLLIEHATSPIPDALLKKHFFRKHGGGAYYGQGKK
jgi:L-ribulose-5-phosphate 4-epimerase